MIDEEARRIKQRRKQKNYRDRKKEKGFKCVQLYLSPQSVEMLERKIRDINFYNGDRLKQEDLETIPQLDKEDYSTIINNLLVDVRSVEDQITEGVNKKIDQKINSLKNKMLKSIVWQSYFGKLDQNEILEIIESSVCEEDED